MTTSHNSDVLRLAVPKELALERQAVLAEQGVPLNVTQSVKAMLLFALHTKLYRYDPYGLVSTNIFTMCVPFR